VDEDEESEAGGMKLLAEGKLELPPFSTLSVSLVVVDEDPPRGSGVPLINFSSKSMLIFMTERRDGARGRLSGKGSDARVRC